MSTLEVERDPYTDGTLVLGDKGASIRTNNGTQNNLNKPSLGAANTPLIHLAPIRFEDGIQSPSGVAFDAEGNPLMGIDSHPVTRQPVPIFSTTEKDRLTAIGLKVVDNINGLSEDPNAPYVLLNPPDRPSARVISNATSTLKPGESNPNPNGISAFIWSFGQFINHDTNSTASGSSEQNKNRVGSLNFPIDIPKNDPYFPLNTPSTQGISKKKDGSLQFDFLRDAFVLGTGVPQGSAPPVPAKALNQNTHWLDLSTVYGSTDNVATAVRSKTKGRLKVLSENPRVFNNDLLPSNDQKLSNPGAFKGVGFLGGDERVSENDSLTAQQTLWMRNHNRIAHDLSKFHPQWTDEQTFQRAREINIAEYENVLMYQWLPLEAGNVINPYQGYDPNQSPEITDEFDVAALRLGHPQTNGTIKSIDAKSNVTTFPLLTSFGAPHINTGSDVDAILRGNSQMVAGNVSTQVVSDLRNALFPAAGVGFDLYAADIQRGRDRGVADYNQVRVSLGLPRVTSFNQITSDSKLADTLQNLYHTVDDVDLLVGLLAEKPVAPSGVGETSQKILVQQYEHLRDSDRFWFERPKSQGGFFTSEEIADIKQVSFADIIKLNTEITDIPENPFLVASPTNPIKNDLLDLTSFSGQGKAQIEVTRSANYNDSVGFYQVADRNGTVVDPITGKSLSPNQSGDYAKVAIGKSVAEYRVNNNLSTSNFNVNLSGGTILAPYIIQNGSKDDFQKGHAQAFFGIATANQDAMSHVHKLGSGNTFTFAFEDMSGSVTNGSDRDFNDVVMKVTLV